MPNPRHLIIRWITPLVWNLFPKQKLATLMQFSLVEKDSGCQLLQCANLIDDPELKAYLFQHVLEEFFHAEIFEELCKKMSPTHLYLKILPRTELVPAKASADDVLSFFAYVHVGEQAVNRDFVVFSRANFETEVKATFRRAGMDEAHHEQDTHDILERMLGDKGKNFRKKTFFAAAKRSWRAFAEDMKAIGNLPMTFLLTVTYFIFGAFGATGARRRLRMPEEEQLRLFQIQVALFEKELR
jgi:hypothetical protein